MLEQWKMVLVFSDESTFTISNHAGNQFVRRRPGEEFKPCCTVPTIKHPTAVMVWGCMAATGVGRLEVVEGMMNAAKYREMLERKLVRSAQDMFEGDWVFQQDNAPCHTAKAVKSWMQSEGICVLDWPAQSPDLSPIENLWQKMARIISLNKPTTKVKLIEAIIAAWHRIVSADELRKLVECMPKRCRLVIENKGWPIKY